jgi:predicted nucleic acid-binding protein
MTGPAEPAGLCANRGVTEASGKVSHARHDIVELARAAGELVIQHPLRACDAVQLAAALRVQSDLVRTEVT